ncbi:MAG: galactokinase [Pyrinomonadaceae bacterium]|nr:galactokinase [Pyrinomonadaceae bacterium]
MIDYRKLAHRFRQLYGDEPRVFRAPGRINLIGEHTDYNGGFVLPMAIERETAVAVRPRNDRRIHAHTLNYGESAEFDLDSVDTVATGPVWVRFVEGMARIIDSDVTRLRGANMMILSDVPPGAGLSSSAALETAVGFALISMTGGNVDRIALAKAGQRTEHDYVGAQVGIMDQFVSAHARAGHALLLDCRSLGFEHVPIDTARVSVVICDTNVKHDLASSEYNVRRAECETAVRLLQADLPNITDLRDVSEAELDEYGTRLPQTIRLRARHVVTENARTLEAADALKLGDMNAFGWLMWESHRSLRDDYEVSSGELDTMVEIASRIEGVLGARMTGGGFGGSTVNLVARERVRHFTEAIEHEYLRATGIAATVLISNACGGASEAKIELQDESSATGASRR